MYTGDPNASCTRRDRAAQRGINAEIMRHFRHKHIRATITERPRRAFTSGFVYQCNSDGSRLQRQHSPYRGR